MVGANDMFAALASGWSAFARPKSSTFTVPSGRTFPLGCFRSRWMTPCGGLARTSPFYQGAVGKGRIITLTRAA